jgi:ppGpp synthetase/RelA/SpoT-type nucleotidyltranferase
MNSQYDVARNEFLVARPLYEALVDRTVTVLDEGLRLAGIPAGVYGRVKDVDSYLTKLLRSAEYLSGERPIQDRAGVRAVLPYLDDAEAVDAVVRTRFHVDDYENKLDTLEADRLGYLGIHYIARPKEEWLDEKQRSELEGLQVEIQVGSMAQRAWADVSHELLYKASVDVPDIFKRMMNRLIALVELFDAEIERCRSGIRNLPGFAENQILEPLDRELLKFSARPPDRVLSQLITPRLVAAYGHKSPSELFTDVLAPWIEANRERLEEVYARKRAEPEALSPLFSQPESFLILERAENDPDGLRDAWPSELPRQPLHEITEYWGHPVD